MIITCENCSIRFNLDETLLNPAGSKVRCSKCQHIFLAYPPPPEDVPEDVEDTVDESLAGMESQVEAEAEAEEEMDFSDLEQMLDSDEAAEDETAAERGDGEISNVAGCDPRSNRYQ